MCKCMITNHPRTTLSPSPPKRKGKSFFKYRCFGGLFSNESGNENMTQRYKDRTKERRDGVNPDYQKEDPVTSVQIIVQLLRMLILNIILRNEVVKCETRV
ncbi:hypothetical protein NPIL_197921 [Nephila pilipes]|uniref:RED-like N-terminal domain-containing protein n=1 Tax=Nephila pilipes TaxID=299642 RepID=A0A8X6N6E3_NEPPI|nr:hypothetical protein NPIL_197921 [Nephila pilipes]